MSFWFNSMLDKQSCKLNSINITVILSYLLTRDINVHIILLNYFFVDLPVAFISYIKGLLVLTTDFIKK